MQQIKNIAIVWESETGGGVNSFLRYLYNNVCIYCFTRVK